MGRELSHREMQELLGVYALDAVDDDEREMVEDHVNECAACRAEVVEHREAAALMASGWMPAPEGVWDRIAGSLEDTPPPMRPVVSLDDQRPLRRAQRGSRLWRGAAVVGVAASVALGAFVSVQVVDTGRQADELAAADVARTAEAAARRDDARRIRLASADGRLTAQAVLLADGTGFLVDDNLPVLSADRTYQLWAVVGGNAISVGVLGPAAGPAAFQIYGSVSALAITMEDVAGGVVTSQRPPTVVGTVT